ncbi:MAG: radical SAM protein [Bacteroidales bacterium]|nr:radical SAM protein [Bacteroidales bacterium]
MVRKHINIPVFIPGAACPGTCIFCDQRGITGRLEMPSHREVIRCIEERLSTIDFRDHSVELAFFGGTFTGLDVEMQQSYLRMAVPYLEKGMIHGIRISTRPDMITPAILDMLKAFRVTTIELGAQSMDDDVLLNSGRGHTASDTVKASEMVRNAGFSLGLQMMTGLPGDTRLKTMLTAQKIISLGAGEVRIYPVVVIRNTPLATLFLQGKYMPLSLDEAVSRTKDLVILFEQAAVRVIRMGLHPSEGLISGSELVAGPFHPAFGALVLTAIWSDILSPLLLKEGYGGDIVIYVPKGELTGAIGHRAANKTMLQNKYRRVSFLTDDALTGRLFRVDRL